ncbi:hypothetical protein [Corallococcus sp. 4LFB]|uniref:hypothetical protein n=1 Tax=Corallococcus sp. 4LFB TaxID=3383249 RepID=UPI0039759EF6
MMEMTATWDAEFPTRRMAASGPPQRPVPWRIETKTPASPRHAGDYGAFALDPDGDNMEAVHHGAP